MYDLKRKVIPFMQAYSDLQACAELDQKKAIHDLQELYKYKNDLWRPQEI